MCAIGYFLCKNMYAIITLRKDNLKLKQFKKGLVIQSVQRKSNPIHCVGIAGSQVHKIN